MPATGNVTPSTGQNNSQVSSQTIGQINDAADGTMSSTGQGTPAIGQGTGPAEVTGEGLTAPLDAMMRWGAVHVHPRASYQFLYATGVHTVPGGSKDTFTHTLAPGVTVNLGPHVTADYSPSIRFFSEKGFHNTVDHAFDIHAGYIIGDWTVGASETFTVTDEPMVETSSQTEQKNFDSGLYASYHPTENFTLTTSVGLNLLYTSGGATNVFVGGTNGTPSNLADSQGYNASESLDYKFNEHLTAGALFSLGYSEQSGGFRSIEEQYQGHLNWHPASKFTASISGGVEQRNFLNSKASAVWNPIYSANLGYQLFEQTGLSIYANRSINSSIFDHQISQNTSVGVGVQQRLLGKLHVNLGFGYNKVDYQSTATSNLSTSRSDESTSYTAGVSLPFLKHCSFSTFYQYSQNTSSQNGFSYDSSQVGASLFWAF